MSLGAMRVWVIAAAALLAAAARADSWTRPATWEVFSASREYFVRIVPGKSLGDTYGFAGAKRGSYARAEFYRRTADRGYRLAAEAELLNPISLHWRKGPVRPGADFVFTLDSGGYKYCEPDGKTFKCR